jgi:hypothetical protein
LARRIYSILRVKNQTAGLKNRPIFKQSKTKKMNEIQKKMLKKAINVYTNLPVDDWYNQTCIDYVGLGTYYCRLFLDELDIRIVVNCSLTKKGNYKFQLFFERKIDGVFEVFNCYETAYNFVPIYTSNYLTH